MSDYIIRIHNVDISVHIAPYQHYGCELYNQTLASNGVTRYNLVWTIDKEIHEED